MVLAEDGIRHAWERGGQILQERAAILFGEPEGVRHGVNETHQRLAFIAGQPLEDREGIDGEGQAIDERMPAVGGSGIDGAEIAPAAPLPKADAVAPGPAKSARSWPLKSLSPPGRCAIRPPRGETAEP